MEDLFLSLEKDPRYQAIIETVPESDRKEIVNNIEQLAKTINKFCIDFDELLQTEEGQDKFMNTVGGAINRRAFYGNNGVTEIPWPEKN